MSSSSSSSAATWNALGSGAASGTGVSASASSVSGLAMATDGTNVAVAWTQTVNATQQIYVLQYSGGVWNQLAGSASGNGISNSSGHAAAPSLAYSGGKLFAAWQDNASGTTRSMRRCSAAASGLPPEPAPRTAAAFPSAAGRQRSPARPANGGQLYLAWIDNEFPSAPVNGAAVYVKSWNGLGFRRAGLRRRP